MRLGQSIEFAPEIFILNRIAVERSPSSHFPVSQPGSHPAFEVRRVRKNLNLARLGQSTQGTDGRLQFHSIIGGELLATADFLGVRAELQNGRPTAWTGISRAAAVSVNENFFQPAKVLTEFARRSSENCNAAKRFSVEGVDNESKRHHGVPIAR